MEPLTEEAFCLQLIIYKIFSLSLFIYIGRFYNIEQKLRQY